MTSYGGGGGGRVEAVGRRPGLEVAAFDGRRHHVGEEVRGAGEGGHAEGGEGGGVVVVVGRGALVGQGQQGVDGHAGGDQRRRQPQQLVGVAALEQVGDEHQHRVAGPGHPGGAVRQGAGDVG